MTNEERFKEIYQTQITRTGAPELLAWLESTDFFTAPASTRFHGAYPGGLVDHSLNVYFALIDGPYVRDYSMETRAICALLHDLCKVDFYHQRADGSYTVKDHFPFGHGEKSVFLIQRFMKLAEPEALIGFAGPRVIEQTIGQTLPEGFQRSEFLLEHGFLDQIVPRTAMRKTISNLLMLHGK